MLEKKIPITIDVFCPECHHIFNYDATTWVNFKIGIELKQLIDDEYKGFEEWANRNLYQFHLPTKEALLLFAMYLMR